MKNTNSNLNLNSWPDLGRAARDAPSAFEAEPVEARVVVDRNRITGGVAAGIDLKLVLLAKLRGEEAAKLAQLAMEYDPEPAFESGSPKTPTARSFGKP